ncbi:sensor histidine kinase [Neptunicella sp. SCSIO 80796]|uniref:sensor histidine kinase n=1 Tax=Neptunicella plasticusilytica TaxID=3117012 RepID=UPI003A4D6483
MGFNRFSLLLSIRIVLLMLMVILFSAFVSQSGYQAASLLVLLLLIVQGLEVVRFIRKTNTELTRFLQAARYSDFSQRFEFQHLGAGFAELGQAFSEILTRFQTTRADQEQQLRHLKAIVEHVPVPLMSIHANDQIVLWNNSARRLFGSHHVQRLSDLTQFGDDFSRQLTTLQAGERRLVDFVVDDMQHQLAVSATQIILAGQSERLLSLQDIQSELDKAQLQAWQDLVRVLTHEIMNSITPVASLARTAVDLVEDSKHKAQNVPELAQDLDDVAHAVHTVARRSEGLMQFVGSYRRLTRLPAPNTRRIRIQQLFSQVQTLATQQWQHKGIDLSVDIQPATLEMDIDVDMVEQLLINLLKNAEQALVDEQQPKVTMRAFLNRRGHVVIEIGDNGQGIADELKHKVFVPFFTTKKDGSGVGLALTRQVMIAHGGSVKLSQSELGGALFSLIF